jgi:glutamyl-tRNA synthetase
LAARQFFGTLRVAVTGRTATPPLFETMEVVGRERVLSRLGTAVVRLTGSY